MSNIGLGKTLWVVLGLLLATSQGRAENTGDGKEDGAWRNKALSLNELSGAGPMRGKLKELLNDKAATKKVLAAAVKLSKERPQPLNRNSTFLLALLAEDMHDVETSAHFYRLNAKQGLQLLSENAVGTAYVGLIQMYVNNKRFADCEKV